MFQAKTYYQLCVMSTCEAPSCVLCQGVVSLGKKKPAVEQPRIRHDVASEFIHKLSHDITGITHNIMGYATLLEEDNNLLNEK